MEYYYATKRQILTFATIGIHLKDIMLCEISQTLRQIPLWSYLNVTSLKNKQTKQIRDRE